jgi:hypothetical protein
MNNMQVIFKIESGGGADAETVELMQSGIVDNQKQFTYWTNFDTDVGSFFIDQVTAVIYLAAISFVIMGIIGIIRSGATESFAFGVKEEEEEVIEEEATEEEVIEEEATEEEVIEEEATEEEVIEEEATEEEVIEEEATEEEVIEEEATEEEATEEDVTEEEEKYKPTLIQNITYNITDSSIVTEEFGTIANKNDD